MNERLPIGFALVELVIAGGFLAIGHALPPTDVMRENFDRVSLVTQSAEQQVQLMRGQVVEIRTHELPKMSHQIQHEKQLATVRFYDPRINAEAVGSVGESINSRLVEQEQSLDRMQKGLGEINTAIPAVAQTTTHLVKLVRWMFWFSGAILAAHAFLLLHGLFGQWRFSLLFRRRVSYEK